MVSFSLWGSKEPTTPAPEPAQPTVAPTPTPVHVPPPTPTTSPAARSADPHAPASPYSSKLDGESPPYPDVFSARSLKQLGFFFGGASFLMLTALSSRRAAIRHMKASALKFYQPTHMGGRHGHAIKPGERDPMIAFEALKLATLGTISFGIMSVGGLSWAFDITNLEELQTKARRSMYGKQGQVDEEAEKEVAEWLVKMLGPGAVQAAAEPSPKEPEDESKKT